MIKFQDKHRGKWVAAASGKVVADGKTFNELIRKVSKVKNNKELTYSLVPQSYIAG